MALQIKEANVVVDMVREIASRSDRLLHHLNYYCESNSRFSDNSGSPINTDRENEVVALNLATQILKFRRIRDNLFSQHQLFSDPSWDMLLDLFVAHLSHKTISITSLCIASQVPLTTALRWITILEGAGLITREKDQLDGRRYFVRLTLEAIEKMTALLTKD